VNAQPANVEKIHDKKAPDSSNGRLALRCLTDSTAETEQLAILFLPSLPFQDTGFRIRR
jgi:hypothetical protein